MTNNPVVNKPIEVITKPVLKIRCLFLVDTDSGGIFSASFLNILQPLNTLKTAGSNLGHKHSQATRTKMSEAKKGNKNPMFGKTHTEEIRVKRVAALKGRIKPLSAGKSPQRISVLDILTNKITKYDSIHEAARAIGVLQTVISNYFRNNQKKPYKGRYCFQRI